MKNDFKNLQIIFLGLLMGQIAFAIVANFMITSMAAADTGVLIYVVPTVMMINIVAGNYIFNANLKKNVAKEDAIEKKFGAYRKNSIIRWAMMEMGNLLAIAAALVEGKTLYFALFAVGLIFFAITRPNVEDFSRQFDLSVEEEHQLKGK